MTNLLLSYVTLFVLAGLLGFAGGWFARVLVTRAQRNDVEGEIDRLGQIVRQARARAELGA